MISNLFAQFLNHSRAAASLAGEVHVFYHPLFLQVDARDSWDRTPLHYACARGLAFAAEILVKSNADVAAIGKVRQLDAARPAR